MDIANLSEVPCPFQSSPVPTPFPPLLLILFLLAISSPAAPPTQPTSLSTQGFTLQFSSDGHPLSLKTNEDHQELLDTSDPGLGFTIKSRDPVPLRLDQVRIQGNILTASGIDGLPSVSFHIHDSDSYLALRIERIEALPPSREYSLHFQMNLVRPIKLMELDYMTEARIENRPENNGLQVSVDWHHTWNRYPENPRGGFVLFLPSNEAEEDETLLKIWVEQGLPHPKVEGDWSLQAAHDWIDTWLEQFSDQSRFWISARTPEDLYAAVPYAEKAGVGEIYLFTDTWRGGDEEPFFTTRQSNWGINRAVFPRGEEDLRKFSEYCRDRHMNLKIHWISGGIGLKDPQYVGKIPDARLASWGSGHLVGPLSQDDGMILFKPAPGVLMPFRLPTADWPFRYTCPPALHNVFDYNYMVVGNEIIKVGSFADTDKDVWCLKTCLRGQAATDPASHAEGEAIRGLVSAYGQNFLPDNDSTLLAEMAQNYAGMLNRCRIANVEYDGAEIHTYNGRMWGFNKLASLVYANIDHPVTSYSSSGMAPPCHLEYRLNATQNAWRDRQKGIVAILLDQPFRPASTVLDAHWGLSQVIAHGYTLYSIMKPEPLFGLTIQTLRSHGLTDQLLETASNWKRVNQLISPQDREQIRRTLFYASDVCEQAGSHEKSELVHILEKGQGRWEITPTRVLFRPGKTDTLWHDGQEHGAISPRQFLKPGETMRLVNPFQAQPPRLVLRVLWGLEYQNAAATATQGQAADDRGADKAFEYAKMNRKAAASPDASGNILLQPQTSELRNLRDTRFTEEADGLLIEANNPLDQPIVTEDQLPEWSRLLNMTEHRGIGMWVTGDNSNAILTFQIPGGDYAVPIDFTGRRYIEIPNAQVAWSTGYWGWRMGNKRTYYDRVNWMKLGFGFLPAKTNAHVHVQGLTALQEIATELRSPVIRLGEAALSVKGSVASGQYLTWEGKDVCTIYDENWIRLAELPALAQGFVAPSGEFDCRIDTDTPTPSPWLEVQFTTQANPIIIPDPSLLPHARD